MALGDSFLEALAVEYEKTMTGRLEQMIVEEFGSLVRIVNTGVGGWNPNHYLIKARQELQKKHYDLVIVFIYMGNDITSKKQARFDPKKREVPQIRMPRGPSYREFVDALIYPFYRRIRTKSHLVIFVKRTTSTLLARLGLTKRPFPPTLVRSEYRSPRWDITGSICHDIAREAAKHATPVIFVLLPADYQVDTALGKAYAIGSGIDPDTIDLDQPSRLLATQFRRRGLEFIDTTSALRKAHDAGNVVYAKVDKHLSSSGHEVAAEYLKEAIMEHLEAESR